MRILYTILISIILVVAFSSVASAESLITPDEFVRLTDGIELHYSENEISEIIYRYYITEDKIRQLEGFNLKRYIYQVLTNDYMDCYRYLIEETAVQPDDHNLDFDSIYRIAICISNEISYEMLLVDLDNGVYYYDSKNSFFSDIKRAEKKDIIPPDSIDSIKELITSTDWNTFDYSYTDPDNKVFDTDMNIWCLVFETKNGIVKYSIETSAGDVPEGLFDIGYELMDSLGL